MPRNASGVYSLPEVPFVAGTTIQSAAVNSDLSDIASALTQSLALNGVSTMTGPIRAASGTVTAPSYTFGSALGTGFYLSGTDEISWTANGVQQGVFGSNGVVTFAGDLNVTGSVGLAADLDVGGNIGVVGAIYAGNGSAGAPTHSFFNDPATGFFIEATSKLAVAVSGATAVLVESTTSLSRMFVNGFIDLPEISAPLTPASGIARLYVLDNGSNSSLAYKDAAGTQTIIRAATTAEMVSASSTASFVMPARQALHPGHPKAGGNLNMTGTPAFTAGDFGMGAVTDQGVGLNTVSFDTAFANTNYWGTAWARTTGDTDPFIVTGPSAGTKTVSTFQILVMDGDDSSVNADSPEVGLTFLGEYA